MTHQFLINSKQVVYEVPHIFIQNYTSLFYLSNNLLTSRVSSVSPVDNRGHVAIEGRDTSHKINHSLFDGPNTILA